MNRLCRQPDQSSRILSGMVALIVHELVLIAALSIASEEVETFTVNPDFQCRLVPRVHFVLDQVTAMPAMGPLGRWPMKCDHPTVMRMAETSPDVLLADTRCEVCGWQWWVIRAALSDECLPSGQ